MDELIEVLNLSRNLLFRLITPDATIEKRDEIIAMIRQIDATVEKAGYPWPGGTDR